MPVYHGCLGSHNTGLTGRTGLTDAYGSYGCLRVLRMLTDSTTSIHPSIIRHSLQEPSQKEIAKGNAVPLTESQHEFNDMLQFFRGRNEHFVSASKQGRKTLDTRWRGSLFGLAAIARIVFHLVALQERMGGPRYDCYGPAPVYE